MIHRRFFVPRTDIVGDQARIADEVDINHIRKTLRLREGDRLLLLDGEGSEYVATISSLTSKEIQLNLVIPPILHPKPEVELTLIQGLPKNPKMDLIIQKATELGITRVIPITTSRSIAIADNRRLDRWRRIGREAAGQSARVYLPVIQRPSTLGEFLNTAPIEENSLFIVLWEGEDHLRLRDILKGDSRLKRLTIFVGPEGGFTEEEVAGMKRRGIISCSLGKQLLRTETAAFVAISIILYELGQLG